MNNVAAYVIMSTVIVAMLCYLLGYLAAAKRIPQERKDAIKASRSVLSGRFSEQLAPYLPDFPFKPTEAKFIGQPFDFLIFKGMDDKEISEIVFVEVKSGNAHLSSVENELKRVIEEKKVSWYEYRAPEYLTKAIPRPTEVVEKTTI